MRVYNTIKDGFIGFGLSKEEAEEDLYNQRCASNLELDTKGGYLQRREELKPWNPKDGMFHINGVGCLWYKDGLITEVRSGKVISLADTGPTIFYHLGNVFEGRLSYTDITIVLRKELNTFFSSISKNFVTLDEMPRIQMMHKSNGFDPDILYTIQDTLVFGIVGTEVGVRVKGEEVYYVIDLEENELSQAFLSYLAYRVGYIFNGDELYVAGSKEILDEQQDIW